MDLFIIILQAEWVLGDLHLAVSRRGDISHKIWHSELVEAFFPRVAAPITMLINISSRIIRFSSQKKNRAAARVEGSRVADQQRCFFTNKPAGGVSEDRNLYDWIMWRRTPILGRKELNGDSRKLPREVVIWLKPSHPPGLTATFYLGFEFTAFSESRCSFSSISVRFCYPLLEILGLPSTPEFAYS